MASSPRRLATIILALLALSTAAGSLDTSQDATAARSTSVTRTELEPLVGRATVEGFVPLQLMQVPARDVSILLTLDDGSRVTGLVKADGTFAMSAPAGTHVLEAQALGFVFPQVVVEVSAKQPGKWRAFQPGASRQVLARMPLSLEPIASLKFFEERAPFDLRGFLMNPMVLIMLFMLAAMFLFPRIIENFDPEELETIKKRSAATTGNWLSTDDDLLKNEGATPSSSKASKGKAARGAE